MKITLTFEDSEARSLTYYLRRKYNSKAELTKLAKMAIRIEAAQEAHKALKELEQEVSS